MSLPTKTDISAGQAIYHPWALKLYNMYVLWFSNNWVWRCPASRQIQHYQQHISDNHLDVGIGTGYYLDKVDFKTTSPQLTLMDLNQNCLNYCQHLLARYKPTIYQRDIFQPLDDINAHFDSIGLNYLLHCVPGNLVQKKIIIQHLSKKLAPEGVLFGSTILGNSANHNGLGRYLISLYNRKKIFCNQEDTADTLRAILQPFFQDVRVDIVGAVALFSARTPI